jgi:dephospho-CoA kinase
MAKLATLLPPKILGLSGTFASGKDTVAAWLNQHYGYYHLSTGDMVREVASARFGDINRPTLHKTANLLRAERGGGVLVELAFEHYASISDQYPGGLIINGVRSLGEAKAIKENGGYLLFIDAPVNLRYERLKARARGDEISLSFEEFAERERRETTPLKSTDETIQNVGAVQQMADAVIVNDHNLDKFLEDVRQILDLPRHNS